MLKYTSKELDLMARLMRAEALSDGESAMLMVGNVIVNRVLAECDLFKNKRTISSIINQSPGGFVATGSGLFQSTSTSKEKNLAKRCLRGEYFYPATNALWFNARDTCSSTWFNMPLAGRYKSHCFYNPKKGMCPQIYP